MIFETFFLPRLDLLSFIFVDLSVVCYKMMSQLIKVSGVLCPHIFQIAFFFNFDPLFASF